LEAFPPHFKFLDAGELIIPPGPENQKPLDLENPALGSHPNVLDSHEIIMEFFFPVNSAFEI